MDRPGSASSPERDRAQLLLVGAIAIALILIGLVVVINTVLFTENVATSESLDRTEEVSKYDYEIQRNMQTLVLQLNHRSRNVSGPALSRHVRRNVTNYSRLIAERYADSGPIYTNVTYNNESSKWGERVVQVRDGTFTAPTALDQADWEPVPESGLTMTRRDVGRFIVNLNVSETSTDPFTINITNRTDDYVSVEFERRSGDINITANRSVGSTTHTQVTCDPSRERVLVDLMRGQSLTSECEFPATRPLDPPYAVTIRNGDRAVGEYGFVVNESLADFNILGGPTGTFDGCDGSVEPDTPCTVPAVWTANVSLEYDSRTITYRQEHNISVYP